MNANELKSALIFGLNHGHCDDLCTSILDVLAAYQTGGLINLEARLFRLKVDIDGLERTYQKNEQYLREYREESAADDENLRRMYRHLSSPFRAEIQ